MRKKSIYVGTPMYGGLCYHRYVSSLLDNIQDLKKHKIEVFWEFIGNESLITRARNNIADSFLKSHCSHLMFIDSDIFFPPDALRKLISVKEDLVCAPYPKKIIDWNNIKRHLDVIKETSAKNIKNLGASYVVNFLDNNPVLNKKGLVEVKHAGTGFMMISREVFLKMRPNMKQARASSFGDYSNFYTEYFKTDVEDETGVLQSEDWVFCNQWRKLGGKVWIMPEIVLGHLGTHSYEGDYQQFGANIT